MIYVRTIEKEDCDEKIVHGKVIICMSERRWQVHQPVNPTLANSNPHARVRLMFSQLRLQEFARDMENCARSGDLP